MPVFIRTDLLQRSDPFEILVDGQPVTAYPGESVAAVLLAAGRLSFAAHPDPGRPRGLFCGMGACFGCVVTLDGRPNVRSCATPAQPGQHVELNGHASH